MAAAAAALAWLGAACLLLSAQVACEYGMVHVVSEMGGPKGKDYCILYNPQWAHLPHDLSKASLLQLRDWTTSMLCSASDLPAKGFSNQIPLVTRGNCTFYDKVRLAQGSGAHGLLVVSKETLVPPGGNKTQYEEIGIPVALLSYKDMLDIFKNFGRSVRAALYAPHEPMLDYNMVIIFIMAVGTVALGGYWAGSRDVKKRYMKHKRDDEPEKQEDEAVDVTPVMTCVFVVMCCSMLVLLYYFYDHLVYAIIGIFCLASSTGLYSCLSPLVQRLPFGKCRVCNSSLPYFHKCPQVRMLLLALFCVGVSVVWAIFRNEDHLWHRPPGDVHGPGPHAAWPAGPPLPGALHADHQRRPGPVARGAGHVLDGQWLCGSTSASLGASLSRRPTASEGLRGCVFPAASRRSTGQAHTARRAASRTG
ncbi:signal peptide peptidase-like 2B isoform X12 [Myotis lucifugus]|uniref:signal peptide peptidase-like 2B isoform X12 n=1 Tax=Myotis lucifugus TaxID=59463 RepID=UPI000CCC8FC3|nr:signal peptide peptidase-like 2B isoform X12 [Myotis lucifugus]